MTAIVPGEVLPTVRESRAQGHGQWRSFFVRRLGSLAAIIAFLVVASFLLVRLVPGDPAREVAGPTASTAQVAQVRDELGLDEPAPTQLWSYVRDLAGGDLGTSFATHRPVTSMVGQSASSSLQLAGAALILVLALSLPIGMLAGALTRDGRHPRVELGFGAVTSLFGSLPEYLLGTLLAFVFAVKLQLLPVAGDTSFSALILPTLAISFPPTATLARIVRIETLNVLGEDYMRTAESKRLSHRVIYFRHALPNVATAALTIGGILFASVIGGTVVVETVFNRHGLGSMLVTAILARDYPVVQGIILILGLVVVVVNMIVDVVLALVDPRSMTRSS